MAQRKPADLIGKQARAEITVHSKGVPVDHRTVYGVVRSVKVGPRTGFVALTIQRPKPGLEAATYFARCKGDKVKVEPSETCIFWRRVFVPVEEWLK